jgi:hypothetical protein
MLNSSIAVQVRRRCDPCLAIGGQGNSIGTRTSLDVGGDLSATDTASEEDGDGRVEGQNELDERNELNFRGQNELNVDGSLLMGIGEWAGGVTSLPPIPPARRTEMAESKDRMSSLKKIGRGRGRCGIGEWMMGFGRAFRQPSGESGGDCRGNPPGFR